MITKQFDNLLSFAIACDIWSFSAGFNTGNFSMKQALSTLSLKSYPITPPRSVLQGFFNSYFKDSVFADYSSRLVVSQSVLI